MNGDSRHTSSRSRRASGRDAKGAGAQRERRPLAQVEPDDLARLLGPVVNAAGMDLESVRVTPAGRRRLLRLVVDSDDGAGLDQIAEVSHEVSVRLDASGIMGDVPYTLEVSSPGVDRPLTEPRHWRRARGRLVSVPLTTPNGASSDITAKVSQSATIHGRVLGASAAGVTLDVGGDRREFGYSELGPGRVQVEFGRGEADPGGDASPGAEDAGGEAADPARPADGGSQDGH